MNAAPSSRPGLRLALTLLLGLLGAGLMPVQPGFIPHLPGERHTVALLVWLLAAFAGAHRLSRGAQPRVWRPALLPMAVAAATALIRTPAPGGMSDLTAWPDLAKAGAIMLLLLLAGATVTRRPLSWTAFAQSASRAIAAPLILFSSRASPGSSRLAVGGSAAALVLVAFACPFLSLGRNCFPRFLAGFVDFDTASAIADSTVKWIWCGCAVLSILSPQPEAENMPASPDRRPLSRRQLVVPGLLGITLLPLALLKWHTLLAAASYGALLVYLLWPWLALLSATGTRTRFPRLPQPAAPAAGARLGAAPTLGFLLLALVPLACWCRPAIRWLFSGQMFATPFSQQWVGWTLDQSTIQCGLWRFTALTALSMSFVSVARWAGDRTSRRGYWAFAAPSIALLGCLLGYLTCGFAALLLYIHAMGFTLPRVYGVLYGVCCYSATIRFLRWALRPPSDEGAP